MSADDWASPERLSEAMRALQGLFLSREARQREAFRQRYVVDGGGSEADIERARRLLAWLVECVTISTKPERFRQLAAMIDAARLEQPSVDASLDNTAPLIRAVDVTLPAATELRPDFASPATLSMDGTFALGELSVDDLGLGDIDDLGAMADEPTSSVRRAPGGTLMTGKTPDDALDIEKYAVLCAWTEKHPERRDALHAQYGIASEKDRAALDKQFEERFRRDPQMRAAFAQRLKLHLEWIRR